MMKEAGDRGKRWTMESVLLDTPEGITARLGWDPKPVTLAPAPKLAGLIRKSREIAASGETDEAEGKG